jgi:hypothetical protein
LAGHLGHLHWMWCSNCVGCKERIMYGCLHHGISHWDWLPRIVAHRLIAPSNCIIIEAV